MGNWSTVFWGTGQQSSAAKPSKNNQTACQCYHCWGWGHMVKKIKQLKGGSFNVPSPLSQGDQKEQELNRPSSNKPHIPQSGKRMLS